MNGDGVSNHRTLDCLLKRLFRRRWKKKPSKLRVTGLYEGNQSTVERWVSSQRASNSESVSIWWRHHGVHNFWDAVHFTVVPQGYIRYGCIITYHIRQGLLLAISKYKHFSIQRSITLFITLVSWVTSRGMHLGDVAVICTYVIFESISVIDIFSVSSKNFRWMPPYVIKWKHFRVTGVLCGESTGHRWIPLTKAKLSCFLWSAPE